MFENFYNFAGISVQENIQTAEQFIEKYEGYTFLDGMYRFFRKEDVPKWNGIVGRAFPPAMNRVQVFAYDWQGRVFAIFSKTNTVLILDPGTGDALNSQMDFLGFHNVIIPKDHEFCLLSADFKEWKHIHSIDIAHNECVGFRVPLFLNGRDEMENLEVSDMEVYWEIMGSLINA